MLGCQSGHIAVFFSHTDSMAHNNICGILGHLFAKVEVSICLEIVQYLCNMVRQSISSSYTMPTRGVSRIHEAIINKPEGVARGFIDYC